MTALTDRLEAAEGLDVATRPAAAFWSKALAPSWLRELLSGRRLGHPVHPALVQVAAGSLLSASALDATGQERMRPAARALVALGLAASVPTVLAGWSDWLDTEQAEKRVGFVHAATNATGITAYVVSWLQRRGGSSGRTAGFVGAATLGVGGWLGGHLAYAQGVGVDTTAFETGPADWADVCAADEVTDGLRQVRAGRVALLLTRVDGAVVALADRCTHRGGPLSDGERRGDCVVCPWHGSEFALATGRVRRGPATRPQPTYEVRETAGRVEVRRAEQRSLRTNPT